MSSDPTEDTLRIAVEAARDAVAAKRSGEWSRESLTPMPAEQTPATEQKAGAVEVLVGKLDKTTLTALIACMSLLATQADKWWASMVRDDETAISRAIDARAKAIASEVCAESVEDLRGEWEQSMAQPPTMSDLSDKQREDRNRIWRIEERLRMGEWLRERREGNDDDATAGY